MNEWIIVWMVMDEKKWVKEKAYKPKPNLKNKSYHNLGRFRNDSRL